MLLCSWSAMKSRNARVRTGMNLRLGNAARKASLAVIQGDADTDLVDYPDDAFDYVIPPSIAAAHADEFRADMEVLRGMYRKWKARGVRNEDARYVLPNACATELVISANFREFRHIFRIRCAPQAQWEIRQACRAMLRALLARAPGVFGDLAHLAEEPAA